MSVIVGLPRGNSLLFQFENIDKCLIMEYIEFSVSFRIIEYLLKFNNFFISYTPGDCHDTGYYYLRF